MGDRRRASGDQASSKCVTLAAPTGPPARRPAGPPARRPRRRPAGPPARRPAGPPARRPAGLADGLPASMCCHQERPCSAAGHAQLSTSNHFGWKADVVPGGSVSKGFALCIDGLEILLLCPIFRSARVHGVQPCPSSVFAFIDVPLVVKAEYLSFRHAPSVRFLDQGADMYVLLCVKLAVQQSPQQSVFPAPGVSGLRLSVHACLEPQGSTMFHQSILVRRAQPCPFRPGIGTPCGSGWQVQGESAGPNHAPL